MCWKKIISWLNGEEMEYANKILISFAINDYPGSSNDLRGCLNDQRNIADKLYDFQPRLFADSLATKSRFISELDRAFTDAQAGDVIVVHYSGHGTYVKDYSGDEPDGYDEALYLYDGTLIDDDINKVLQKIPEGVTVVILFDSCFSGTATRKLWKNGSKGRFYQTECMPKRTLVRSLFRKKGRGPIKWIAISGCGEKQTSADAFINGSYNGAFTWYAMKSLNRGMTYKEWHEKIRTFLPSSDFEQKPELEGPDELINKIILT